MSPFRLLTRAFSGLPVLALAATAAAQCELHTIATLGGQVGDIDTVGTVAYIAQGRNGIQVYDISDPVEPRLVEVAPADRSQLAHEGPLLCAAGGPPGLSLFDITDPSAPTPIAEVETPWTATELALVAGFVYAVTTDKTVARVDVRDPAQPVVLPDIEGVTFATDIAPSGSLLCVATGSLGLKLVDVSDPLAPALVGTHPTDSDGVAAVPGYAYSLDTSKILCIDLSDPAAPVTVWSDSNISGRTGTDVATDGTLLAWSNNIYDVSRPQSPVRFALLGSSDLLDHMAFAGGLLIGADAQRGNWQIVDSARDRPSAIRDYFSCGYFERVVLVDDAVYIFHGSELRVTAISPSGDFGPTDTWRSPFSVDDFWTDGLLLVAAADTGCEVVNVSDPAQPVLLGSATLPAWPRSVAVRGSLAYMGMAPTGIAVVDFSSPSAPAVIGTVETDDFPDQLRASGGLLAAGYYWSPVVELFDVSTPSAPALVSAIRSTFRRQSLDLDGTLLALAKADGAVEIHDVSEPALPTLLSRLPLPLEQAEVTLVDDILFVGHVNGLGWWSLTDPSQPTQVGSCDRLTMAASICTNGAFAVARASVPDLSYEYLLATVEVAPPAGPTLKTAVPAPGGAHDLAVVGDTVMAIDTYGFIEIDVSDPQRPTIRQSFPLYWGGDLAVAEPYLFVRSYDQFSIMERGPDGEWRTLGALVDQDIRTSRGRLALSPAHAITLESDVIRAIDRTDPSRPWWAGALDLPWRGSSALDLQGAMVCVANESAKRLFFIDASDPAAMTLLSELQLPWGPTAVLLDGDWAYVASVSFDRLGVVDTSDPLSPLLAAQFSGFGRCASLSIRDQQLVVAGERASILDVSDPLNPRLVAESMPMNSWLSDAVLDGNRLYLAGSNTPALAFAELDCSCPADFDADGDADTHDIITFLNAWVAERTQDCSSGDCSTDLDANGLVDTRDFVAFLNAWAAGC